jgi:ribosomal protein L11 methyltransferase
VLDVGTGSGILALVALKFGASRAVAVDNDPDVIGVAVENAERNGLQEALEISTKTLGQLSARFPCVVANIRAKALERMAAGLAAMLEPAGTLILSGVLEEERDALVTHFEQQTQLRMRHVSRRGHSNDAWVAIVLRAPP